MIRAAAAAGAVALAKARPGLGVGLHLVLVEGRSVLPRAAIPGLVDARGRFGDGVVSTGLRYFFSRRLQAQLEAECRAQIEAFLATGLPMDHLNAHNHLHIHPTILEIPLRLLAEHGLKALRLPRQTRLGRNLGKAGLAAVMAPWVARAGVRLRAQGFKCNDATIGLFESGAMVEGAWLKSIAELRPGVTEAYCHPAAGPAEVLKATMPRYRHEDELAALLSPRVRRGLEEAEVRRISFRDLA
jgi:hopanoid biosynthesis associated protein HpnK